MTGPPHERSSHGGRPPWRDGLWIGLAALACYVLLQQDTLYKADGHYQLIQVHGGRIEHPEHFLYSPVLYVWMHLLEALGVSIYRAGTLLSAVAMAIGVAISHRGFGVLGLSRARSALAAGLVATAPAIVFFATVVELHALFFAFASTAFVAAARLAERPTLRRGLVLGLATGVAYLTHATGILLVPMFGGMCLALALERGQRPVAMLRALVVAGVAYTVIMFGMPLLLSWAGFAVSVGRASKHFFIYAQQHIGQLDLYPQSIWQDWVWRFLPLSVAWIPAACARSNRLLGLVFLAAVLMYSTTTLAILGPKSEWGAYNLPLTWLAALLIARTGPAWWTGATIVLGAVLAVVQVKQHDTDPSRAFAQGVAEATAGRSAVIIIGNHLEIEGILVHNPQLSIHHLLDWAAWPAEQMRAQGAAGVLAWAQQHWDSKREIYLTDGARAFLVDPEYAHERPSGPILLDYFDTLFRIERVEKRGFAANRLLPK